VFHCICLSVALKLLKPRPLQFTVVCRNTVRIFTSSSYFNVTEAKGMSTMMIMMMMIVDLYSALHRAPLLRYMSRCIVKRNVFSADQKRSDAERWITEMIRQQVPDYQTCHGEYPTSDHHHHHHHHYSRLTTE